MKTVLKIEELDCAVCAGKMEENIKKIEGIDNAVVSFFAQKIVVESEKDIDLLLPQIIKACKKIDRRVEVTK